MLSLIDWSSVTKLQDANAASNRLLERFSGLYDIALSEQKIWNFDFKIETLNRPCLTKIVQRLSMRKQKLYEKCSKKKKQKQWRKIHDM